MDHRFALYSEGVPPEGVLLEIGPGYNPVYSKSDRTNYFTLDHATTEELEEKYLGNPHLKRIEKIDFVWREGPLHAAIPEDKYGTFDGIIAAHVLEHSPNPLSFLKSAEILLAPKGVLMLAMPDKRYIFDFFKSVSTTSDYLYAFYQKRSRHTKKTAFDELAFQCSHEDGLSTWYPRFALRPNFWGSLSSALEKFETHSEGADAPYTDYHGTVYTPTSFDLIMLELNFLGFIGLVASEPRPPSGCEFYRFLRRGIVPQENINDRRMALLRKMIVEVSEQASMIS